MSILLLRRGSAGEETSDLVTPGLLALFEFNEGAGQTLGDGSGSGRNGTLGSTAGADTNDPTWSASGLSFATDDYVECGSTAELRPAAWTVCVAVKMTPTTVNPIVGWGATAQYPAVYGAAPFNNNRPIIWLNNTCFRYFEHNNPVNLQDGAWHFLVFSCPGNTSADIAGAALTADGQTQAVNSTTSSVDGAAKAVCRLGAAGTSYFAGGEVAFLSMHNRVLSTGEQESMRTYAREVLEGRVALP